MLGAKSANRAAKAAAEVTRQDQQAAENQVGGLMFGPADYKNFQIATAIRRKGGGGFTYYFDPQEGRWIKDSPEAQSGNGFFQKYPSLQAVYAQQNPQYMQSLDNLVGTEQGHTREMIGLAKNAEGIGADLEQRQKAQIQRDASKQLTGMNRDATARLGWMGPSTLVANQQASNARNVGEQSSDAMLNAANAATGRLLAARGNTLNVMSNRYGLEGGLMMDVAGRKRQTALEPAQAAQSMMGNPVFQPHRADPSAYGMQSPLGNSLATLSQPLMMLGGMGMQRAMGGGYGMGAGSPMMTNMGGGYGMMPPSANAAFGMNLLSR